jgi:hypothetical protein
VLDGEAQLEAGHYYTRVVEAGANSSHQAVEEGLQTRLITISPFQKNEHGY